MKVAPISYSQATDHSQEICRQIHLLYSVGLSTKDVAEFLKLSRTTVRHYFYGIQHTPQSHYHWKSAYEANRNVGYIQQSLNQVRVGTSVPISYA